MFKIICVMALGLMLGGCFMSAEVFMEEAGDRITMEGTLFACGLVGRDELTQVHIHEERIGNKYIYRASAVGGTQEPVTYGFHHLRDNRYLAVMTVHRPEGMHQYFLPVHLEHSALVGVRPNQERMQALAKKHNLTVTSAWGGSAYDMEGSLEAKKAFKKEVEEDWVSIQPHFVCVRVYS